MKKTISVFLLALGLLTVLDHGTGLAMGRKPKHYSDVKTITKEELSEQVKSGVPVQIVNVLSPNSYKLGMIKGSKKIPLNELEKRLGELDKTQLVVTYCASYRCGASAEAAHKLTGLGYNVRAYEGGIKEWKEAGLPVE